MQNILKIYAEVSVYYLVSVMTAGEHAVVFALNVYSPTRAQVLSASCIVSQAWSTMKIPLEILTKF